MSKQELVQLAVQKLIMMTKETAEATTVPVLRELLMSARASDPLAEPPAGKHNERERHQHIVLRPPSGGSVMAISTPC